MEFDDVYFMREAIREAVKAFEEDEVPVGAVVVANNKIIARGYNLTFDDRTSGPINAILFDWKHGSMWGGSSNHGEDYGIAW